MKLINLSPQLYQAIAAHLLSDPHNQRGFQTSCIKLIWQNLPSEVLSCVPSDRCVFVFAESFTNSGVPYLLLKYQGVAIILNYLDELDCLARWTKLITGVDRLLIEGSNGIRLISFDADQRRWIHQIPEPQIPEQEQTP
jgi:hypothetical protein